MFLVSGANGQEHSHVESCDDCGCSTIDGVTFCYVPESNRGSSNITREEAGRLACMPEFVTPDQITLQDKEDNGNGEQRGNNPLPIKALIVIDEQAYDFYYDLFEYMYGPVNPYSDVWAEAVMWTTTILETGDDYMESQYGIDFIAWQFELWTSNNSMKYDTLLDDLSNAFVPANYGCDVVVLMTGKGCWADPLIGSKYIGIAHRNGSHFLMNIDVDYPGHTGWHSNPLDHIFAHEASHLFDCGDHTWHAPLWPFPPCCVQCYKCAPDTKSYCVTCGYAMSSNRFRFDSVVGYVTAVTDYLESGGGAHVFDRGLIIGLNDGLYTELYSGSSGNKAVLYVQVNLPPSTAAVSGTVYLRAYSGSSGGNHLLIYKSADGATWDPNPIINTNFCSANTPTDINCGYVSNFKYLSIVVINDYGYVGTVNIDAIHVHS